MDCDIVYVMFGVCFKFVHLCLTFDSGNAVV